MKAITKDQVLAKLVKGGFNSTTASEMITVNFDYAVKTYPTLKSVCQCLIALL